MSQVLQDKFPEETQVLRRLFESTLTQATLDRLDEIYRHTESIWERYVTLIPKRTVNYLLLAEAPPWSASGPPQYILDPDSRPRTLMRALCHAFFGTPLYKELGSEKTLVMLAERGFLVIDTIPFAMPYGGKRGRRAYKKLVAMTCASYLREKLDECALKWNNQVKIAFAFNVNARTLIEHLGGTLRLGGVTHRIAEEMIAASGAGYPDGRRLTEAYDLHANVR